MSPLRNITLITVILALGSNIIKAVPVEQSSSTEEPSQTTDHENNYSETNKTIVKPIAVTNADKDLDASNSQQQTMYVLPERQSPGGTDIDSFDPSTYGSYLTPEAFQQYLAQFAGAFGPYGYPGYGPTTVYPAPHGIQTGYDALLVPAQDATSLSTSGALSSNTTSVFTSLTNLFPNLMESSIFRIFISITAAIVVLIFGTIFTTAICNLTPLCDISFKGITYLRGKDAGNVGGMVAEEITPERVTRATDFVRSAIRKYKDMQNAMTDNEVHD